MQSQLRKKTRLRRHGVVKTPDVILVRIFQFAIKTLIRDFLRYRSVCSKWHRCILHHPVLQFIKPHHQKLKDRHCRAISAIYSNLISYEVSSSNITDAGVRALSEMSSLSHLRLAIPGSVTSDGLQALGALVHLKHLSINHACLAEEHGVKLDFISGLSFLLHLDLQCSKITDVGLSGLHWKSPLKKLRMYHCKGNVTTHALVRILRPLTKLKELYINFSDDVNLQIDTLAVTQILTKHCPLHCLYLGELTVNDETVQTLAAAPPGINVLSLLACKDVTDIGARALGNLTSLTKLHTTHLSCTDTGYPALTNLIHIRELRVEFSTLTDFALSCFRTLVNLEELNLSGSQLFTGTGFRDLDTLTKLRALYLEGCFGLTDDGIRDCARAFKNLHAITIGCFVSPQVVMPNTELTSAAWRHLSECASPTLNWVDLSGFDLTEADKIYLYRFEITNSCSSK